MLRTRIITALVLVALLAAFLFYASQPVWLAGVLLITFIAGWEWAQFAKIDNTFYRLLYGVFLSVLTLLLHPLLPVAALFGLAILSAAVMTALVVKYQLGQGQPLLRSPSLILLLGSLVLIPFAISFIEIRELLNPLYILFTLLMIWAIDTGAYFSGRAFGKRKLAVFVSPGKTWEGVYGGFLLALLIAFAGLKGLQPILSIEIWQMALLLTVIALYSVVGDLFESLMKRQVALKDSSQILPGHGGVLDRIDSLILSLPFFYLLWLWVQ